MGTLQGSCPELPKYGTPKNSITKMTKTKLYRVWGYGTPMRVWKAEVIGGLSSSGHIESDTILKITDATGYSEEVFGSQVSIDYGHHRN